ncbi:hypothetical protein [Clostridium estertheticum]|uniref:hypothetical protein n=1 Tax=Clostridium estertheticum TaxID=238834 RepID=UPI001FAAD6CC|nr:hypothetical protein [Clostridium estertheticum]
MLLKLQSYFSNKIWEWSDEMLQCPFLTTMEEEVECFKECDLHKWSDNGGKCPFVELKDFKPFIINNITDYDIFSEDRNSQLKSLYKDRYL